LSSTAELASLIEQFAGGDGAHPTAIPRVFLHRASRVSEPLHTVYEPAVCFVAQGRKQAMAGESIYVYDEAHYLVVSVDIPIVSQILDARPERPFLCLRLDLDPAVIGTLMLESDIARAEREHPGAALAVSAVTPELLDATIRLVRLLATQAISLYLRRLPSGKFSIGFCMVSKPRAWARLHLRKASSSR
jgi:hypothetical protein